MGIIQRQAFLNTIINYAGVLIGFLNVVILFPLFLSQEEFGLTRLVLSLATIMAQLSSFGVHRIAIKFFPIFRKERFKNNGLLVTMFIMSGIGFILVSVAYLFLKDVIIQFYQDDSSLFSTYFIWVPIATLGLLLFMIFESFLQALQKTVFTNLLRNVLIRFYWFVAIILYYYQVVTFFQFMIIFMLGYFFTAFLCVFQLYKLNEFKLDVNKQFLKKRFLKPITNYGFYTLLSGVTLILAVNIDLIMIGAILPENKLVNVGVYAIALYIVAVIYIPNNALLRIASPIIAHDWKRRNISKIDELYKKSSVILIFSGCMIFGCIFLNVDDILNFMKPEYIDAKPIIIILGLSRVFDMAFGLNYAILVVTKFYRAEALLTILLLILVILTNLLLIPIYGIIGAALGTAIVFFCLNITLLIYLKIKVDIHPFTWNAIKMIAFALTAGLLVYNIPLSIENKFILIALKSSIFCLFYFLPVYFFKVSEDINKFFNKYLSLILLKR